MFSVNCLFLNCSLSQLGIKIYRIVFYKFLDGRPGHCKSNVSKIMEENFHMCHYFCVGPDHKSQRICIFNIANSFSRRVEPDQKAEAPNASHNPSTGFNFSLSGS